MPGDLAEIGRESSPLVVPRQPVNTSLNPDASQGRSFACPEAGISYTQVIRVSVQLHLQILAIGRWMIDALVYELHGLTEEEIAVAEGLDHE